MLSLPIVVPSNAGSSTTLQQAYSAGANGLITLDSTRNGILIRDASPSIGAAVPLFAVQATSGASIVSVVPGSGGVCTVTGTDSSAATTLIPLAVAHSTSATATAGIASALDFQVQNGSGALVNAVRLVGMLHTVTGGSEAGTIIFQNIQTGALANAGHWRGTSFFSAANIGIGTVNATGVSTTLWQVSNTSSMWTYNSNLNSVGGHAFVGTVNPSGARQFFVITPSANTASTLNTAIKKFEYSAYTHQFATGSSIGTQREVVWNAPTYAFVGASTLAVAATFAISGAPIAGTNATITKGIAFWVQGGYAQFDGRVIINTPDAAPTDADLPASSISFYLDEAGNNLKVRATYADGTTRKTGTLAVA